MRLAGARLSQIAAKYGVSEAVVSRSLSLALEHERAVCSEMAEEYRALELARFETLRQALWPVALGVKKSTKNGREIQGEPNLDAVDRLIKISARVARMIGLDAPSKTDTTNRYEVTSIETREQADAVLRKVFGLAPKGRGEDTNGSDASDDRRPGSGGVQPTAYKRRGSKRA